MTLNEFKKLIFKNKEFPMSERPWDYDGCYIIDKENVNVSESAMLKIYVWTYSWFTKGERMRTRDLELALINLGLNVYFEAINGTDLTKLSALLKEREVFLQKVKKAFVDKNSKNTHLSNDEYE